MWAGVAVSQLFGIYKRSKKSTIGSQLVCEPSSHCQSQGVPPGMPEVDMGEVVRGKYGERLRKRAYDEDYTNQR